MKKIKIIYNPFSGNKSFKFELDVCISKFQEAGYDVSVFRSMKHGDINKHISTIKSNEFDAFAVSGGDGTLNIVVNAMMKYNLNHIPIGIIPSGTANDFAGFLKMPKNVSQCCDIIAKNNTKCVDLGKANDTYFINVCAGGLFSNVSQNIDKEFKDTLGKIAYYIKGIEQIPTFTSLKLRITNSTTVFEDKINLFLVLNSSGTGGIEKLSPTASISDGMFDFIGFRNARWHELPSLVLKFFKGEYLSDNNILFFKDSYIKIEKLSDNENFSETDLDGEQGPSMPVEIINIHHAIKFFVDVD